MNNETDVAGFQFDIEGLTITGASGGSAAANGFSVSASGSTIIGFSLTGSTIPSGNTVLVNVSFSNIDEELCLANPILSSPDGSALDGVELGDCYTVPVGLTADVQIIHNSADPTVDIYVNGGLAIESFEYRTATPVLSLPTLFTVGIAPAGGDVIAEFPFELMEGGSYVVVATGLLGNDTTPFDLAATATTFGSSSADLVGLEVYHGSTDAPAVDIWADDSPLLTDFSYGDFSGFVEVPAADYSLGVAPAGSSIIAAYTAPLSGLGGGSAVVFASGFLSGDDPAFGLFAALANGSVLELPALEQDCNGVWGGDAEVDACGICGGLETDPANCLQYFTNIPEDTGVSSLVVIEAALDLDPGDEIGLFDSNGLTNYGDCSNETGEILVGAGVWTGSQLNLVGVGSVDVCAFGGVQLAGYIEGNAIEFKVWKAEENTVYDAEATYSAGSGQWGDIITSVSLLEPIFSVTQTIELEALMMNSISFNVVSENSDVSSVFADNNVLITSNDAGQYYAPNFGVDLIGEIDFAKGYDVFLQEHLIKQFQSKVFQCQKIIQCMLMLFK